VNSCPAAHSPANDAARSKDDHGHARLREVEVKHQADADQYWDIAKSRFKEMATKDITGQITDEQFWRWVEGLKPLFVIGFELGWATADYTAKRDNK